MSRRPALKPFFLIAVLFALADQVIKQIVDKTFSLGDSLAVLPGFFNLVYLRNSGGAFSILDGLPPLWGRLFFICATLAALAFVLYLYRSHPPGNLWGRAGMILVFGGGLGNLVDRVAYGEVIDYLLFYYGQYHWPAFNLADSGITVGVGLMIVDLLRSSPESASAKGSG
ncbi:MAG: signal peptidase II [Nitrospinae bacterium]|nr:signal peptidase II [Nitrospinota bacterium]